MIRLLLSFLSAYHGLADLCRKSDKRPLQDNFRMKIGYILSRLLFVDFLLTQFTKLNDKF